ncbi:hypothetical protein N692_10040 [Lactiplantibacillus plantarum EGD-AQ4]|nr:hypothetical protein N692_10040 [Lactiplantibacillus plantarum EGD-AQ4]
MTATYSKPLRHYWWLIVLLMALMGLSGCRQQTTVKTPKQAPSGFVATTDYAAGSEHRRQRLANFIKRGLLTKQGLYTNYLDTAKRTTATATSHDGDYSRTLL